MYHLRKDNAVPPEESNCVIVGDALQMLPQLIRAGKSYDVIIADPPYNIGKDFGNNQSALPVDDYVRWAKSWITLCLTLLKDDGLLYLYGFPEIVARISAQFPLENQRWLVWHYTNKTVPALKFWQRSHEAILCLWKPGRARVHLEVDQIREPYTDSYLKAAGKRRKGTPSRFGASNRETVYNAHEKGALPRDVIKIPALAGGAGYAERWFLCRTCGNAVYPPQLLSEHRDHDILKHPTQKPLELTKKLIRSRINDDAGGQVLIPFAGSGSECVAAQALGVEFLGIELNPAFADFANKWLNHPHSQQQKTPLPAKHPIT